MGKFPDIVPGTRLRLFFPEGKDILGFVIDNDGKMPREVTIEKQDEIIMYQGSVTDDSEDMRCLSDRNQPREEFVRVRVNKYNLDLHRVDDRDFFIIDLSRHDLQYQKVIPVFDGPPLTEWLPAIGSQRD